MKYLNYIQPVDIAKNILRKHPHWFHGKPKIVLIGDEGEFGELRFDFGDEIVSYGIYIKDGEKILDAAYHAIYNFVAITDQIMKDII